MKSILETIMIVLIISILLTGIWNADKIKSEISEKGLKGIIEEVWYGTDYAEKKIQQKEQLHYHQL